MKPGVIKRLWIWRWIMSVVLACSFVIPVGMSSDYTSLLNGVWITALSFWILRLIYRKVIFKVIFGYEWSKSREDYINKFKIR